MRKALTVLLLSTALWGQAKRDTLRMEYPHTATVMSVTDTATTVRIEDNTLYTLVPSKGLCDLIEGDKVPARIVWDGGLGVVMQMHYYGKTCTLHIESGKKARR